MNLKWLEHFVRVAEAGSVSKAANATGVNQPALSRSIKDLEASLSAQLFYRDGRGVRLTEDGARLLTMATEILASVDAVEESFAAVERGLSNATVGMLPSAAHFLTVPLTERLRAEHPEARVHFLDGSSGHVLEWLADGRLDLAVVHDAPAVRRYNPEPVLTHSLMLVGSVRHPALPEVVQFDDLGRFPLILTSRAHATRREVDHLAATRGVKLDIAFESDSMTSLLQLVEAGYGWSVLPGQICATRLLRGLVQSALVVEPRIERTIVLATPLNRPQRAGVADLIRTLKQVIRDVYADHAGADHAGADHAGPR
ncbi:MAG: LysR family transcriptional regulator [Pseudomonadota bacterium]|nr:LysR family transcriptional regulator [Pseudomonadota bacterium]